MSSRQTAQPEAGATQEPRAFERGALEASVIARGGAHGVAGCVCGAVREESARAHCAGWEVCTTVPEGGLEASAVARGAAHEAPAPPAPALAASAFPRRAGDEAPTLARGGAGTSACGRAAPDEPPTLAPTPAPQPPTPTNAPPDSRLALARGSGQRILVVTGDADLAELLSTTLELAGYRISLSGTGVDALAWIAKRRFDLVVFDTDVPDMGRFSREHRPRLPYRPPVLLLSGCDRLHRLVPELGPGERDYVTKPFRVAEVLARIQVLLRGTRPAPARGHPLQYGDLVLDDAVCRARRGTRALELTPAEYRLLRHLLANAHRVLSKEQIGRYVWGDHRGDNAIEQLVSRLRRKVDRDAPSLIHTRRGFGYWLGRGESRT